MNRCSWYSLVLMFTATAAPAASYFVAIDGKAENGGSRATPWPSVAADVADHPAAEIPPEVPLPRQVCWIMFPA